MDILTGRNISGVILAGGANRRFGGRIKANELVGGRKIIDRIVETITGIFEEIILVTNTPLEFKEFQGIITGDHFKGKGPLGGIHAAVKRSEKDAVFVFAGDMPFLSRTLITDQIIYYETNFYDIVIPSIKDKPEPLHGIYSKSVIEDLEKFLSYETTLAIRDFLQQRNVGLFELDCTDANVRAFTNINTVTEAFEVQRNEP